MKPKRSAPDPGPEVGRTVLQVGGEQSDGRKLVTPTKPEILSIAFTQQVNCKTK